MKPCPLTHIQTYRRAEGFPSTEKTSNSEHDQQLKLLKTENRELKGIIDRLDVTVLFFRSLKCPDFGACARNDESFGR